MIIQAEQLPQISTPLSGGITVASAIAISLFTSMLFGLLTSRWERNAYTEIKRPLLRAFLHPWPVVAGFVIVVLSIALILLS